MTWKGTLGKVPVARVPVEMDALRRVIFDNGMAWGWLEVIGEEALDRKRKGCVDTLIERHGIKNLPPFGVAAEMERYRTFGKTGPPQGWNRFFFQMGKSKNLRAKRVTGVNGARAALALHDSLTGAMDATNCVCCGRRLHHPDWVLCQKCELEGAGTSAVR